MGTMSGGLGALHPGASQAPGIIPSWLGVVWALLFAGVLLAHLRHVTMACPVPRRWWHVAHVLMAASMAVMYLPVSLDPLHIPPGAWRAVFIGVLGVLAVCCGNEIIERRAISGLWLLVSADMAVMLYMWSPGVTTAPASLIIAGLLLVESVAWVADRGVVLDRPMRPRPGVLLAGTGVLGVATDGAPAIGATLALRITMAVMALGMFSMTLAMAVAV